MSINIRKVRQNDARQYVNLINSVWKAAYSHIFSEEVFIDKEKRTEEKIKKFNAKEFNNETNICLVAEENNKIVGVMFGSINSKKEYYLNLGYADLMVLYILPEFQGQGIASKFKAEFIKFIRDKGFDKFVIGVLKDNLKARKVYEKWGGKLDNYTTKFKGNDEVFYTYRI